MNGRLTPTLPRLEFKEARARGRVAKGSAEGQGGS